MLKIKNTFFTATASAFILALSGTAQASDFGDEVFFAMEAATDSELDSVRGMAYDIIVGDVGALGINSQNAVSANNSVNNSVTGSNSISNGALGRSNGIAFIVQNTGNNTAITAGMNISVNYQDSPALR